MFRWHYKRIHAIVHIDRLSPRWSVMVLGSSVASFSRTRRLWGPPYHNLLCYSKYTTMNDSTFLILYSSGLIGRTDC
jgi:hypothetical protein